MSDDKDRRGPEDGRRINLSEDYELRYWMGVFGLTEAELRAVVQRVGNTPAAVAKDIGKRWP